MKKATVMFCSRLSLQNAKSNIAVIVMLMSIRLAKAVVVCRLYPMMQVSGICIEHIKNLA
jgi:hypothetical protein